MSKTVFISLALIAFSIGFWFYIKTINRSLEAERTLHAYSLTLDLTSVYCASHPGMWPRGWDDLINLKPLREHPIWQWPKDIAEIQSRIDVDFTTSLEQVEA